nr:PREDICTED: protein UXT homolog [Bemisia tabaci]
MTSPLIPQKVLKFESFINDVLKEELKEVHERIDYLNQELADFSQLKSFIESVAENNLHEEPLKSKVDVGCNIYLQAVVSNPSQIYIDVGLGLKVLFTHSEALQFIRKRTKILKDQHQILQNRSAQIRAHIKLVLHGIQELQNIK